MARSHSLAAAATDLASSQAEDAALRAAPGAGAVARTHRGGLRAQLVRRRHGSQWAAAEASSKDFATCNPASSLEKDYHGDQKGRC